MKLCSKSGLAARLSKANCAQLYGFRGANFIFTKHKAVSLAGVMFWNEALHPRGLASKLSKIEFEGVWIGAIVMLPVLIGQWAGFPIIGLFFGIGGLLLAISETPDSTARSLWLTALLNAAAMFIGTLVGYQSWASVALMFAIAFAGGWAARRGEGAAQIGFIVTVVFAVAIGHRTGAIATDAASALALGAGSAFAAALTQALWHFKNRPPASVISGISGINDETPAANRASAEPFDPSVGRHALRIAIASALAAAVYKFTDSPHGYWMIITVLVIVKPQRHVTRERTTQRIIGSVAGGLMAIAFVSLVHNPILADVLLVALCVMAFSHFRSDYAVFVLLLTPFVILLISSVAPGGWALAWARIIDTFIGAFIAIATTHLLRRPRNIIPKNLLARARLG